MTVQRDERTERFAEAYIMMSRWYRPCAPGDGLGSVELTTEERADPERLWREAEAFAKQFAAEDDDCDFHIGCSDFTTNRAFVFVIEAARLLASGSFGRPHAAHLLRMALAELRRASAVADETLTGGNVS